MKIFRMSSIFIIFNFMLSGNAYRILGVFPLNGKSHNIILESVVKTLAKHGHQVDVISHFPLKKPLTNINHIIHLNSTDEITKIIKTEQLSEKPVSLVEWVAKNLGNDLCHFMGLSKFQQLIRKPQNPPYDLVITEAFSASCYIALGHVFNVPVVGVSTSVEYPWVSSYIGDFENSAFVPNRYSVFGMKRLNFWERMQNFYLNFKTVHDFYRATEKSQTESMRKYLRPDIPNVREVEKSVALILVNSHPNLFGVKPITPGVVQIAGLHIEVNDEIMSANLQKWMDESIKGVIYFSLGTFVPIETFPVHQLTELYALFEKISPIRVLLRVVDESKLPPGLPKNVKTLPWVPQQPVLAHPNTRAFITHGGLASLQEALYYGVPTIGIPLFSDQFRNVEAFIAKGAMIRIYYKHLTRETLDSALTAVLENSDYKKNAVRNSKLFRDRPMSAANSTVFWVEYVIRNGGDVLKSPAMQFSWWQLNLIDIYLFLLLTTILGVMVAVLTLRIMSKYLRKALGSHDLTTKRKVM